MPSPINPQRAIRVLVGRHRRLSNTIYRRILTENPLTSPCEPHFALYRGLVNDLVVLFKELREQEVHRGSMRYLDILDEVEAHEGANFTQKVKNWLRNNERETNQDARRGTAPAQEGQGKLQE